MTTEEQTGSAPRDRHGLILEYLRTAPGFLSSLSALLAAVTGLVVALAAR
ncbi:hypothetical protein [Micromonospora sp. WMMD712]|nr:hypothetical protein [Micromonospora sp. WMMD712]WFE58910.1 hypothetical protein O7633_19570 [Micromonospora sp. WMMD712]